MAIKLTDIFTEDVINKTKDITETLTKKSAEHIATTKKRVEYLDVKSKLTKEYEKYGELQYQKYIGQEVSEAEIQGVANRIGELKARLEIYNFDIEEAKAQFTETVSNVYKKTADVITQVVNDAKEDIEINASGKDVTYEDLWEADNDITYKDSNK